MEDLYEQEEKCQKSLKTLRKAIFMRFVVAAVMVWAIVFNPKQMAVWGLAAFVLLVNGLGAIPLIQEWKRQRKLLKDLIAREEE